MEVTQTHLDTAALDAGLAHIRQSPTDGGELKLIVRRPAPLEREVLHAAQIDVDAGLVGDQWRHRPSSRTPDRSPHPGMQLTIMNARVIELIAQDPSRWELAGDQLYVDLDLSEENLPPWTRLAIGQAIVQVTDQPHTGCAKFTERFGRDASRWVNTKKGLNLRGVNAKVIQGGTISPGDILRRIP